MIINMDTQTLPGQVYDQYVYYQYGTASGSTAISGVPEGFVISSSYPIYFVCGVITTSSGVRPFFTRTNGESVRQSGTSVTTVNNFVSGIGSTVVSVRFDTTSGQTVSYQYMYRY